MLSCEYVQVQARTAWDRKKKEMDLRVKVCNFCSFILLGDLVYFYLLFFDGLAKRPPCSCVRRITINTQVSGVDVLLQIAKKEEKASELVTTPGMCHVRSLTTTAGIAYAI